VAPRLPQDKNFTDLVDVLKQYFGQAKDTNYVAAAQNEDSPPGVPTWDDKELHLYAVKGVRTHPIQVSMMLNGTAHILKLDMGAAVTIMS